MSYTRARMRGWILTRLAELLELEVGEIEPDAPLESYGLDSASAVRFSGDLEDELEASFESSLAYDYPSVEELLDYLQARGLLRAGGTSGRGGG